MYRSGDAVTGPIGGILVERERHVDAGALVVVDRVRDDQVTGAEATAG